MRKMGKRSERAKELFCQGYNCSQSVFAAFADRYGLSEEMALKLSASFGGGFGRLREVCGTVSGMALVCGLETGATMGKDIEGKKHNYEVMQKLAAQFKEDHGSIICKELLGLTKPEGTAQPEKRTPEYYKKRPCKELIGYAALLLEQEFGED